MRKPLKRITELSKPEKRILIAEARGWRYLGSTCLKDNAWTNWTTPDGWTGKRVVPNYPESDDAMRDVLNVLQTRDQQRKYMHLLARPATHPQEIYYDEAFDLFNATPEQKADALILTLGLALP